MFLVLAMDKIPMWLALAGSVALGAVVAVCVRSLLVPYFKRKLTTKPVNFVLGVSNGNLTNYHVYHKNIVTEVLRRKSCVS